MFFQQIRWFEKVYMENLAFMAGILPVLSENGNVKQNIYKKER